MSLSLPPISPASSRKRSFAPSALLSQQANVKAACRQYDKLWKRAADDPAGFWAEQAESLAWFKKWDNVLEWNAPFSKWFVGGKINACFNCVDRHLAG